MLDTLGWVHYRAGKTGRAREFLAAAVKGAPDDPSVHFHLAAVYVREGNMDLARSELKAALDSPRPFPERLEALRLSRENLPSSTPNGKARTSSTGH
jgi:predicted Zn-dependent protease